MADVRIGNPRSRAHPVLLLRSARRSEDHVEPNRALRQRRCREVSRIPLGTAGRLAAAVLVVGILSASSLEGGQEPTAGSATELVRVRDIHDTVRPAATHKVSLSAVRGATAVHVMTAQDTPTVPRVRSHSARIVDAIARGVERSATFRGLIATIDATDGLVFVEDGRCGHSGIRACLLLSVTIAGPHRLLRIIVETKKAPGCELIVAVGHELQHAVEVLRERHIRTDQQIRNFFDTLAPPVLDRFETDEAVDAAFAVAREACRGR